MQSEPLDDAGGVVLADLPYLPLGEERAAEIVVHEADSLQRAAAVGTGRLGNLGHAGRLAQLAGKDSTVLQ